MTRPSLRDPIAAWVGGALLVSLIEIVALRAFEPGLASVAASLLALVGLMTGVVVALQESAVARLGLGPLPAAATRALGALLPLAFVGRTMFEGARAQVFGAVGPVAVPVVGYLGLVVALWGGARLAASRPGAARVALWAVVAACEWANRSLYRSEYADIHAFLVVVSVSAAGLALHVGAPPARPSVALRLGLFAAVFAGVALSAVRGLDDGERRWRVATRGCHTRHLARLVRDLTDRDGDGASSLFAGGDCDEASPAIGPSATEVADNGIDEECGGSDLPPPPPEPPRSGPAPEAWLSGPEADALRARTRSMNLLVLAVDALRADIVFADDGREAMPATHALLDRSVVFRRAFAPSAGTDVSVSGIVTGRIDPFGVVETTLPEALRASGRRTAAVLPTEVLRYAGSVLLGRGVDEVVRYVNDGAERDKGRATTTPEVVRFGLAALDRLSRESAPFSLWLHFFDVHEHREVDLADPRLAAQSERFDLKTARGKYRALAAVTDIGVARVLAALEARGLADRTIVVLLSDHGESLGEDARLPENHGRFVYNALTHVPLAIHVPGVPPRVTDSAVSLLDLTPTLLELAGAAPMPGLDGRSLLPHLSTDAPEGLRTHHRPIALNESEQWGLVDWPLKLMVRPAENLVELYDLEADFAERHDLSAARGDDVRRLKARYATLPRVSLDRTRKGRKLRDERARAPASH